MKNKDTKIHCDTSCSRWKFYSNDIKPIVDKQLRKIIILFVYQHTITSNDVIVTRPILSLCHICISFTLLFVFGLLFLIWFLKWCVKFSLKNCQFFCSTDFCLFAVIKRLFIETISLIQSLSLFIHFDFIKMIGNSLDSAK